MKVRNKIKEYTMMYRENLKGLSYSQLLRVIRLLIKYPINPFKNSFMYVLLSITYRCQCGCAYCYAGLNLDIPQAELTTQQMKDIINQVAELPYFFIKICFSGGEPLLRDDIFILIEYAKAKGLRCELNTNGIDLFKNVKKLRKSGLQHIYISLDNSNPKMHDNFRRKEGCYEAAIRGIKECIKQKLAVSLSVTITKENLYSGDLEKIIELGRDLGVTSIRLLPVVLSGRYLNEYNEKLSSLDDKRIKDFLEPGFVYLENSRIFSKERKRICAFLEKTFFYISCYGEVRPCCMIPLSFGNAQKEKLVRILDSMHNAPIFKGNFQPCLMNDPNFRKICLSLVAKCL